MSSYLGLKLIVITEFFLDDNSSYSLKLFQTD